jgi:hypothetical protein
MHNTRHGVQQQRSQPSQLQQMARGDKQQQQQAAAA